jgi:thioredoxin-like negative regulator of GroEL
MFAQLIALTLTVVIFGVPSLAQRSPFDQQAQFPSPGLHEGGSLSGNVRGSDDQPLKNVRVELHPAGGTATLYSLYTNGSGNFEFMSVANGRYEIVASVGLAQTREQVEVNGMVSFVNIRLAVTAKPPDQGDHNSISVSQYKVPEKAREEFKKASKAAAEQKVEEAGKHLEKALAFYPTYADALTLRGILKLTDQDMQGAVSDLQEALKADGNCALAYIALGASQNMESKFDDAIRSLQRGQSLSPRSWQAYFEMGKALIGKGSYEPALVQLARAETLAPSNYALIHLVKAHAMLALNNYSDAMTELQAYLAKDPNGPESPAAREMLDKAKAFTASKQPQ